MSVFFHKAYGYLIQSDFYLPELPEFQQDQARPADIVISRGERPFTPPADLACKFDFTPETAELSWAEVATFIIPDASRIIVEQKPDIAEEILRLPLLGPVLAFLLHRKGYLVLHASAVAISSIKGIAFLGDKGAGKSTTAAAFLKHGHQLVADDILAIATEPDIRLAPGFPQLKLSDESSDAVALSDARKLPAIGIPGFDKRKHLVSAHFTEQSVVPERLYVLQRGDDFDAEVLSQRDSFQAILRFSYLSRFGNAALQGSQAQTFFSQSTAIGRHRLVSRLTVPRSLDRLEDIVSFVQSDLSRLSE